MTEDLRCIVFDTETTGVSKDKRAVEVAMMEIDPETLEPQGTASSLINPGIPSEPKALAVHGLTEEMLKDAPTIEEWVQDTFGGRLEGKVALIGHRIAFDKPLFEPIGDVAHVLDTLVLTQNYITQELPNRKLDTLKEHLGLEGGGESHRAMADVITAHQLLKHLVPLTGRSLLALATVPYTIMHYMPWGKFEDTLLMEVPREYRSWLLSLDDLDLNLRKSLELVALSDPPRKAVVPVANRRIVIPHRRKF